MRCTDCNFIKFDGDTFCLLDMHRVIDMYGDKDCKILNDYKKYKESLEESNMSENEITMKPIPYRHIEKIVEKWVKEQYPQIENNITKISFSPEGIIVKYGYQVL